jgi:hypothetical protein
MPTIDLNLASAALLGVLLALGAFDGLYLHLWRYQLPARAASRHEHRLHTATAALTLGTLAALFLRETGGLLLWTGVAFVALDLGVAIADMVSERDSRAELGGLSTGEYVIHMLMMASRGGAVALALGARPASAWSLESPVFLGPLPEPAAAVAWASLPGAVAITLLHLWLCTGHGVRAFLAFRAWLASGPPMAPRWFACCVRRS